MRVLSFIALPLVLSSCAGGADARSEETDRGDALETAASPDTSDARVRRADLARIKGDTTAKVWLVIISDFQCPYCKQWHELTAGAVEREYVATGKLRVAYVHYPLDNHQNAVPAAEASMCAAAQERFWPFHDRAFAEQDAWAGLPDATAYFGRVVASLGVDTAAYARCIADDVMLAMISADRDRGRSAGVNSTPSFFVGSHRLSGAAPFAAMKPVIDSAIAEASRGTR